MSKKIILDAGHGGWDNGAMYNGRKEKDDALRLTKAVGSRLAALGNDVEYTRTTDIYQSPVEKAKIGNESGADWFISFHRNASPQENQYSGVQTLIYNTGDEKEKLGDAVNQALEQVGFQNLGNSVRPNLAVLKRTNMPAALLEVGFINTDKDNQLFDEKFDQIADAIAQAIDQSVNRPQKQPVYSIQLGLFRYYENAERLAQELSEWGYTVEIVKKGDYYAVYVGRFMQLERAQKIEQILQEDGFDTWIVAR